MIRWSRKSDEEQIEYLLKLCFGNMVVTRGAFDDIEYGRYLVYEINGLVVALTGVRYSDTYQCLEIDWTCTLPKYRHKGYMQALFKRLLQTTDEAICCNCWYIGEGGGINLQSLMDMFGFKCILKDMERRAITCNCIYYEGCPYRTDNCICGNDLYLRDARVDDEPKEPYRDADTSSELDSDAINGNNIEQNIDPVLSEPMFYADVDEVYLSASLDWND